MGRTSYFITLLVLIVSVGVGVLLHLSRPPKGVAIGLDEASFLPPITLSPERIHDYNRDGAILVRNLLSPEQVARVNKAIAEAPRVYTIFDIVSGNTYNQIRFDVWRTEQTIANLALKDLPKVASQLLPDEPSFRLLRDAYFSYSDGGSGCGWHVDDQAFWPTQNDTAGVTMWIALDDMTGGGGLVVANHTNIGPDLVAKCREAIAGNTCDMAGQSPECQQILEDSKIQWQVQAGDAIIWNRWVFHRTEVVNTTTNDNEAPPKKRYSIRYIPSNARAMGAVHSTLDQGDSFVGSPYYPQVWPVLIKEEMKALEHGLSSDIAPINFVSILGRVLYKKAVELFAKQ